MKNRFKVVLSTSVLALILVVSSFHVASAQSDDLVTPGSVWELTFVKIKPHSGDKYLEGLKKTWNTSMSESLKAGLIKSYMILGGDAANDDDFNLLLMVEFENYAAMDPNPARDKKQDEIQQKIRSALGEDEYKKIVESYSTLREIQGVKTMRQVTIN
jgi:hypothetical protein